MPKKREKNGEEFWRGKCRELAKEVRQLKKQLRYYQRQENYSQDEEVSYDSEDTHPTEITRNICQHCGKGELKTFEIIGRWFEECNVCDHRKKL